MLAHLRYGDLIDTQARYRGIINNYLLLAFGKLCLRDLGSLQLQKYFSAMAVNNLAHESKDKIRDTLSSILAVRTSHGTWLKRHAADMKDIQGQMRHLRISRTMDTYVQDIPESRKRAVEKLPVPTMVH